MPDTPASAREQTQAARKERRSARTQWRHDLLKRAAAGESRKALAKEQNVSPSTIQRALTQAETEQPLGSRLDFVVLQRQRLEKAVQLAESRIADGDVSAAYVMIQLMPLLEKFDDWQRSLTRFAAEKL